MPLSHTGVLFLFLLGLTGLAAAGIAGIRLKGSALARDVVSVFGAAMVFFSLGCWFYESSVNQLHSSSGQILSLANDRTRHVLSGQVVRCPLPSDAGVRLTVALEGVHTAHEDKTLSGLLSLTVEGISVRDVTPGDMVRFAAKLRPVRNFKTPGAFDLETWWALRGVVVTGYVDNPQRFYVFGHQSSSAHLSLPRCWLENARKQLLVAIISSFSESTRGVAAALLLGEKVLLSPEVRENFSRAGIGHLLAVSGIHMGLVALLLGWLARFLLSRSEYMMLRFPVRKTAVIAALSGVVIYAGLAGFSPSAVRAMVMILAFGSALLLNRPQTSMNALAIAAWSLLLVHPLYLFGISFQLSFTAVFFLLLIVPRLRLKEQTKGGMHVGPGRAFFSFVLVTLVAGLATAPLIGWYFQRVSAVGLFANLFMVPLTGFVIIPCLGVGAFLYPLSPDLSIGIWAGVSLVLEQLLKWISFLAKQQWAAFWISRPELHQVALAYGFLVAVAFLGRWRHAKSAAFLLAVLLASSAGYNAWDLKHRNNLVLHVLDVGQGTCQVVELPGGKLVVVDAGGVRSARFDVGERVVAPFIRSLGYRKIDVIVASHPEHDHVGGLRSLVEQFPVQVFWSNDDQKGTLSWNGLISACKKRNIRHVSWTEDGVMFFDGGVEMEIMTSNGCDGMENANARSLVLKIGYGNRTLLLTGDIDSGREACLLERGIADVDVVVVPHHGSSSSSSERFVSAIKPEIAVFPAGWRNRFGFPEPEVVKRYQSVGSLVLRTGTDGTVRVETDGKRLRVYSIQATQPFLFGAKISRRDLREASSVPSPVPHSQPPPELRSGLQES